jgi:UDP-glucose 4-epimerase
MHTVLAILSPLSHWILLSGPFVYADVLDYRWLESLIVDNKIQWVIHLSAILSALGERIPDKALALNNGGIQVSVLIVRRLW